jgi:hypothetical protein
LWHQIATYFVEHRGALGSCLHKTTDGLWLAYSRWPDKETRDNSWPCEGEKPNEDLPGEIKQAMKSIKDCAVKGEKYPQE